MWNKYLKSSAILKKGFQHYHNDNMLMQINFNTIGFFDSHLNCKVKLTELTIGHCPLSNKFIFKQESIYIYCTYMI